MTINGRTSFELKGSTGQSPEDEIVELVGALNGVERYAMLVFALPAGKTLDQVDLRSFPDEYIQCAGGCAGRLTCEVREGRPDAWTQHVLGRAGGPVAGEEVVEWNGYSSTVRSNEVLNADEVTELFLAYFQSGSVPSSYTRRELDLS